MRIPLLGGRMRRDELIAVVGCGYVGLVTAVGLAEQGFRVQAYDVDPARIAACRAFAFPILEPGLNEAARAAGDWLTFHDVGEESWSKAAFTFLAVPTPQGEAGYPNLSYLRQALSWIAASPDPVSGESVIVIRSTVPPGTARWVKSEIERLVGDEVLVAANPEFLQEGSALQDFRQPSRILIGTEDAAAAERLCALMAFSSAPVIVTDTRTAELTKYASNAFLAMRVSFANELSRLAEQEGADPLVMLRTVGMDPRIGSRYLWPGVGYGGSCLPKDVAALISLGSAADAPMELMRATQEVNDLQRRRLIRALTDGLDGLSGRRVAILGLAFKPGTNDVRESPGLRIARDLVISGVDVIAWDAAVMRHHLSPADAQIGLVADLHEALRDVDAAVLCTEWPEAVDLDFSHAATLMRGSLLIDGRYVWNAPRAAAVGLELVRIGSMRRPRSSQRDGAAEAAKPGP